MTLPPPGELVWCLPQKHDQLTFACPSHPLGFTLF